MVVAQGLEPLQPYTQLLGGELLEIIDTSSAPHSMGHRGTLFVFQLGLPSLPTSHIHDPGPLRVT